MATKSKLSSQLIKSTLTARNGPISTINYTQKVQLVSPAAPCRQCSSDSANYSYGVSRDPSEWKYVEHILPKKVIPDIPPTSLDNYPTPSGWLPQQEEKFSHLPYYVARTKNHHIPVYIKESKRTPVKFTEIDNIRGNIWALDADIREHLEANKPGEDYLILTQVHEPGRFIRVRGVHTDSIAQFLIDKGF